MSTRLRETTREAHVAVEAAFALDARLAGSDTYADLLVGLRGFYGPVEAALGDLTGWSGLTPALEVGSRRRAALLDQDLERLGVAITALDAAPPMPSLAHGLGCLYVLEGSALGGRIVARRARAALGEELPVAFFNSAARTGLAADWRGLQAALDCFGAGRPEIDAGLPVVAGALATFRAMRERLEAIEP